MRKDGRPFKPGEYILEGKKGFKKYDPAPRCLYCDKANLPRTKEHVIPEALGGNIYIPKATCTDCQRIINREVEAPIVNAMYGTYGPIRFRLGVAGRRPHKKDRRTHLELRITDRNGRERKERVPLNLFPMAFIGFTTHYDAGIIRGVEPSNFCSINSWIKINTEELAKYAKPGESVSGLGNFHPWMMMRLLAKIAHSFAMANYPGEFTPFLRDFILGKSNTPLHFISSDLPAAPNKHKALHKLDSGSQIINGRHLYFVNIQLFSDYETPEYTVIVGEKLTSQLL